MKPLSRSMTWAVVAFLAALMIVTRFKHAGDALHLPDASMAVFFLGGLYVRRHLAFAFFVVLAVLLDWISISYAGVSAFCITAAYAFLPLAYAALWYGGRAYADRLHDNLGSLAAAWGIALVCASVSFAISNGSFYWLGGRYAHPHMSEYVARLWQWGPLFLRTTMTYLTVALMLHGLFVALRRVAAEHDQVRL